MNWYEEYQSTWKAWMESISLRPDQVRWFMAKPYEFRAYLYEAITGHKP